MADLTRQALAVNQAFLALGNEVFEADGARFVRNRAIPAVWDCNHVAHVTASKPEQIDRLLARADKEFNHISYRRFDVDAYTPPEFEARLSHEGYRGGDALVMVLEGGPAGEPKPCEIRPIENEADWQAYEALHEIDWRDYVDRLGRRDDVWVAESMYRARRAKSPPVRYWLAWAGAGRWPTWRHGRASTASARWRTCSPTPTTAIAGWRPPSSTTASPTAERTVPGRSSSSPTRRTRRNRSTPRWASGRWRSSAAIGSLSSPRGERRRGPPDHRGPGGR